MKKKLLLIPLFATLLCGCTLEDLMFWKSKDSEQGQKDEDGEKDDTPQTPTVVHVSSVTLGDESIQIEEMQSKTLTYTVSPSNADNKAVEWVSSNTDVVTVNEGVIYDVYPGTATITVTTVDGNKTDTCEVEVTEKDIGTETVTKTLDFCAQGYTGDSAEINAPFVVGDVTFTFSQGTNEQNAPKVYKPNGKKEYSVRLYPGNTLLISTGYGPMIRKVTFLYGYGDGSNEITTSPEGFNEDTWRGSSGEVLYTVGGTSGARRIQEIAVTYEGSEPDPEQTINLGVKSISEVKDYIAANPVTKNAYGNGVNDKRIVTIKGRALAKIDLVKSKSAFGLDVSEHGKVILADSTGYIAAASKTDNQGTCLWGKVSDNVNKTTSNYIVTGYLSEYLGHPEICVVSFQWDQNLEISLDFSVISDAEADIDGFYTNAKDVYYNCAGHGYGEVLTLNNLKCYYSESGSSGKRFYNFTDGESNIRVNAYNLSTCSVGHNYNIVGIISLKDLSPIIFAFAITNSSDQNEIPFDYASVSTSTTVADFRTNFHGDQDDVDTRPGQTRFDETIGCFKNVYSVHGYLAIVTENDKLYVGISETYRGKDFVTGKTAAMASGILLIENDRFWNQTEEQLAKFNSLYQDYMCENNPLTMYFVPRQQGYQEGSVCWQVLLIPDFINSFSA